MFPIKTLANAALINCMTLFFSCTILFINMKHRSFRWKLFMGQGNFSLLKGVSIALFRLHVLVITKYRTVHSQLSETLVRMIIPSSNNIGSNYPWINEYKLVKRWRNGEISKIDLQLEILQNYYDSMKILKGHWNLQNKVTHWTNCAIHILKIWICSLDLKKMIPQSVRIAILEDCVYPSNGTNYLFRRKEMLLLENGFPFQENRRLFVCLFFCLFVLWDCIYLFRLNLYLLYN